MLIMLPVIPSDVGLCSNSRVAGPPCYITPQSASGSLIPLGTEEWVVKASALYSYPHANTVRGQTSVQQKMDLGHCWHHSGLQRSGPCSDICGMTAGCGVAMNHRIIKVGKDL